MASLKIEYRLFYTCFLLIGLSSFILFQTPQTPVFADADYACLPIPQERSCLPGTMMDVAKVTNVSIGNSTDGLKINSTITSYYKIDGAIIYILQVTDDDTGYVIYRDWKPYVTKESNVTMSFADDVAAPPGRYSLKILVWADIDKIYYPLALEPEIREGITVR